MAASLAVSEIAEIKSSGNKRSGNSKQLKNQLLAEARTPARTRGKKPDIYVDVDDATFRDLIEFDQVKVERSGSRRKNKDGTIRDYRGKYVAIRKKGGGREVVAFGKTERMKEYLCNRLNVFFCRKCHKLSIEASCDCFA